MYIAFGLLIVTLTYFTNFSGPVLLRNIGWLLVIVGMIYPFFTQSIKYFKEEFEEEKKEI
ncbi:hypothetical protein [Gottfriedia solisilvae]|uniref:hypothetical protein n=1 Tax=Gottfriedia solisilvae TaxID=1516104 RepID=UPI000B43AE91|nr:hypothetical protein [Gottfriedia solisilvae]